MSEVRFDIDAQIAEVRREIALRRSVYPHFIARGKMDQPEADLHMGKMEAVHKTLEWVKANRERMLAIMEKEKQDGG